MQSKRVKIFKIIVLIAFVAIMVALTIWLVPIFKNLSTEEGRINFKDEIESLGTKGIFAIIGLMIIQIFLPILPGEPVEILAGMSYGPIGGLLVIFLGAFISSVIIFFSVRKYGKSFIYSFASKEKIEKLENLKLFSQKGKIEMVLFILFFIPGTPKDLLVYISGLLPVKPTRFLFISTFARFPSIISSTIAGSNLVAGNFHIIAITYLLTFLIAILIIFAFREQEKEIIS